MNTKESVRLAAVSADEIQALNREYRQVDKPTNVLTFTYGRDEHWQATDAGKEHEIFICEEIGQQEASDRKVSWRDYCALLCVHGLLHAAGLDHEESLGAEEEMHAQERSILESQGFQVVDWYKE